MRRPSAFSTTFNPLAGLAAALAAVAVLAGCRPGRPAEGRPRTVVAASSYLESAAREFLGADMVVSLAPPGMCPGHFDLKPSHAAAIRNAALLVRFDFQARLDKQLSRLGGNRPGVVVVKLPEGLGIPATYLQACRQVGEALVAAGLVEGPAARKRLEEIADRLRRLDAQLRRDVGHLAGTPVLASEHQAAFCRYLGLKVSATFPPSEAIRISQVEQCLSIGRADKARCVVANLQEGTAAARGLADRLKVPMVVFSNFPAMSDEQRNFDAMARANVAALLKALR